MPIPKIIHQTWGNKPMPEKCVRGAESAKFHHADFEYRLYNDEDMYRIMRESLPQYYDAFMALPRLIMKIDMFRFVLMYLYGGVYADMDYLFLRPFDLLDFPVVIPANRENSGGYIQSLGNSIFASVPGHPFWLKLIDSLNTLDRSRLVNYTNDNDIIVSPYSCGNAFLTESWRAWTGQKIFIVPRRLFHPEYKADEEYIESLRSKEVYGIHQCSETWRDMKM